MAGLSVKPPRGPNVGGFDDIGYNASKHGVVTLTRYGLIPWLYMS